MANKEKLNYTQAQEIIEKFKKENELVNGKYTYNQMLILDRDLCGLLGESKAGRGVYYSYHTIIWILNQLDINFKWTYEIVDYTNYAVANPQVVKGLSVQVSYEADKIKSTLTPTTLQIMDNKMNTQLALDAGEIEFGKQRTFVKAIAETSGLGHMMWLKPDFVITEMQAANNPFATIASNEQVRLNGGVDTNMSVAPNGTLAKVKSVKPKKEVVAPTPMVQPTPTPTIDTTQPSTNNIILNIQPTNPTPTPTINTTQPTTNINDMFMAKCVSGDAEFITKVSTYAQNKYGVVDMNVLTLEDKEELLK